MATDANETSTDERDDESTAGGSDESTQEQDESTQEQGEKSQEEMAAEFEERKQRQYAESRRKVGTFQMAATVVLVAIALGCLYLGSVVTGNHPLVQETLYVLGAVNLGAALAIQIRKNWSRTIVLVSMPLTIIGILITFTNTTKGAFLVAVLCIVEIYLMFRQPVLDEYDAPKE